MLTKLIENIDRLMTMCVPMQHRTAWIEAKPVILEASVDTDDDLLLLDLSIDLLSCVTANNSADAAANDLRKAARTIAQKRAAEAEKLAAEQAEKAEQEKLAAEQPAITEEEAGDPPLNESIATDTDDVA